MYRVRYFAQYLHVLLGIQPSNASVATDAPMHNNDGMCAYVRISIGLRYAGVTTHSCRSLPVLCLLRTISPTGNHPPDISRLGRSNLRTPARRVRPHLLPSANVSLGSHTAYCRGYRPSIKSDEPPTGASQVLASSSRQGNVCRTVVGTLEVRYIAQPRPSYTDGLRPFGAFQTNVTRSVLFSYHLMLCRRLPV
jgi:hypothetical protein